MPTKVCSKCKIPQALDNFYKGSGRQKDGLHAYCKNCQRLNRSKNPKIPLDLTKCSTPDCTNLPRNRFEKYCSKRCGRKVKSFLLGRRLKQDAVAFTGGSCSKCGYNKSIAALNFHHRDTTQKEFLVTQKLRPWSVIVKELQKCDLVCANCHRELHADWDKVHSKPSLDRQWRQACKTKMLEYKGYSCQNCSYDKYPEALAFHHRDPKTKAFNPSQRKFIWERLQVELDKCDLLCFNCHAEQHFNKHPYANLLLEGSVNTG